MIDEQAYAKRTAEMLIVGFAKCWTLAKVASIVGHDEVWSDDSEELHRMCPFMPAEAWRYRKFKGVTPVRAFVATQWPKLAAYLIANEKKPERLLLAAEQVMRLKCKTKKLESGLSDEDIRDGRKNRQELRRVETANKAAREQQLSTQRGAWSTCKA